ncbi:MAG: zinc ribbon domain-containing protein [Anaerolineales bacterium]
MTSGAIFLILALALLVGVYVAQPFLVRSRRKVVSAEEHELSGLLAERDRLITALQELDFDFTLGKIPSEDYPAMRAMLLQRGADVLRKLDALMPQPAVASDAESRIEAAIAARRADAAVVKHAPASDDELESLIAARRSARKERTNGFCPKCGKPILKSDKFCPHCGKPTQ